MASEKILTVTEGNFGESVLKSSQPVLLDFWAEWCGPCRMLSPLLDELAAEYDGKAKIGKVNVDQEPGLAGQFGVQSIPTLLLFKNGQVVGQLVGMRPKGALKQALDGAISA
jgi:thioredoxin 1